MENHTPDGFGVRAKDMMGSLTLEEGKFLVRLARNAIESYLRTGEKIQTPKVPARMREPRGVFVTLTYRGGLRGCIGHPLPRMPLVEATIDAAISSAAADPRFPRVEPREMRGIKIEVSVLTQPELMRVKDPRDYPKRIEIGKHGLVVEWAGLAGLLLPQVPVEWKWDAEEFLSQTCMKAGLSPNHWLRENVRISRFSAQVFSEVEPGGEVVERELD